MIEIGPAWRAYHVRWWPGLSPPRRSRSRRYSLRAWKQTFPADSSTIPRRRCVAQIRFFHAWGSDLRCSATCPLQHFDPHPCFHLAQSGGKISPVFAPHPRPCCQKKWWRAHGGGNRHAPSMAGCRSCCIPIPGWRSASMCRLAAFRPAPKVESAWAVALWPVARNPRWRADEALLAKLVTSRVCPARKTLRNTVDKEFSKPEDSPRRSRSRRHERNLFP